MTADADEFGGIKDYDVYRSLSVVATGVLIKAGVAKLHGYYIFNNAATVRYVKFYNKVSAPTVGTDVPVLTIGIPAGAGANVEFGGGVRFPLGLGIGATTGVADADTAAPSANDVVVNILYR